MQQKTLGGGTENCPGSTYRNQGPQHPLPAGDREHKLPPEPGQQWDIVTTGALGLTASPPALCVPLGTVAFRPLQADSDLAYAERLIHTLKKKQDSTELAVTGKHKHTDRSTRVR